MKGITTVLMLLICQLAYSQKANHTTIDEVKFLYKSAGTATTVVNNKQIIKVTSEGVVLLNNPSSIKKINYRMYDINTHDMLCSISIKTDSLPIYDSLGVKVAFKDNSEFHFRCTKQLPLQKYYYEIETEDVSAIKSKVLTIVK